MLHTRSNIANQRLPLRCFTNVSLRTKLSLSQIGVSYKKCHVAISQKQDADNADDAFSSRINFSLKIHNFTQNV